MIVQGTKASLEVQRTFDRRTATALLGLGVLFSGKARGAPAVEFTSASRLTPLEEQHYTPPTSLREVSDIYHRMTTPVRIDGKGPFAFIVDTGANQTVISTELAQQLGLPVGPSGPLNGIAGVQIASTTVATLEIGGAVRPDITMSLLSAAGIGAAGMLGLDGLEGKRITLDFRSQSLRIEDAGRIFRNANEVTVKARCRDGQLTLVDADLDEIPITAFLDSGAQNTIGNLALLALALRRRSAGEWTRIPLLSATGQTISAQIADLPHLRVASLLLPSWPVAFADLHTFRLWKLVDKPAILLGVDVLSRFQYVCLDLARSEVRFRAPEPT
jgi:predicted aspartyl protease